MKAFKVIRDPKGFELVADETRRRMIYLLRVKEQSVSQIAEQLGKTPQAIYHHIRKLLDGGLIEVAREERIGHLVEAYYRATAEVFTFTHGGEASAQDEEPRAKEILNALPKVGLPVEVDDEIVSKVVKIFRKVDSMSLKPEMEEKIAGLEEINFLTKQELTEFVKLLTMSDKQCDEYIGLQRELRELLKSRLVQPVQHVQTVPKQRKA